MAFNARSLFGSALMRRLYLQIYATIIGSLFVLVFLLGLAWELVGRERVSADILTTASRLVALTIPPANASQEEQRATLQRVGMELEIELLLLDAQYKEIASFGSPSRPADRHLGKSGWFRTSDGRVLSLLLPDGRVLLADARPPRPRPPVIGLVFLFTTIGLVVAVAVYPISRRLTRRLENLQKGVDQIGSGALSTRVKVEGRDEIAHLAERFNAAAARIEQLVEAHRLLLANASHELRTPLSRIKLGLELEQSAPSEKQREALRRDIAELNALIDEILVMSRLDTEMPAERKEPIDLLALVAEECARFDECAITGTAPEITGDPRLLHRMVRNVLENAFKYGKPPVEVFLEAFKDQVSLTITDAGDGIPSEDREKVFQPFYRGSGMQNVDGYGLGLPLVRKIAEAHGGTAHVQAGPASGASIRITLPVEQA